jgi:phosphatidylglycerophosphate synthase
MVMINDEVRKVRDTYGHNRYNPIEEQLLFRPLSKRLARFLKHTAIHPDHLSVVGFLLTVGVSAIIAYTAASWWILVILLFLCMFFDKVDGDLARIKGIASTKGQYIDGMLDAVGEVLLVSGIAIAVHPPLLLAMLSAAAVVLFNYHGAAAPLYLDIVPATHKAAEKKHLATSMKELFSYGRAKLFLAIIILVIIHQLAWLFIILPLLILYTLVIFYRNVFVKKLTVRS